jgi:hypothetical protein
MEGAADDAEDCYDKDYELAAAHLRLVDNRISNQSVEDLPI